MSVDGRSDVECEIRKLRKKLRQIETLENSNRTLTDEEHSKVKRKTRIRRELHNLLSCHADVLSTSLIAFCSDNDQNVDNFDHHQNKLSEYNGNELTDIKERKKMSAVLEEGIKIKEIDKTEQNYITSNASLSKATKPLAEIIVRENDSNFMTCNETTLNTPKDSVSTKRDSSQQILSGKSEEFGKVETWIKTQFRVRQLKGHNGLITSVSLRENLLLSGSYDTTVKLWDVMTGKELHNMCGHTDTVTSTILLNSLDSSLVVKNLKHSSEDNDAGTMATVVEDGCLIGISVSLDCCFKIWNLITGRCLKSTYTFNPLTCLTFKIGRESQCEVICGTAGGKLEVWNASSTNTFPTHSTLAHDEALTTLSTDGELIICGSANGCIKIFELQSNELSFCLLYCLERLEETAGKRGQERRIYCLGVYNQIVYFGDDGVNIKALDWKSGEIRRLANHTTDFGCTTCLLTTSLSNLLIASGYDLDNSLGYINVRSLPDESYLCSLCDEETDLIVAMTAYSSSNNQVVIVTGGNQLKIWSQMEMGSGDCTDGWKKVNALFIPRFERQSHNSDNELDSDTDCDLPDPPLPWQKKNEEDEGRTGWLSWCSLL